MARLPSIGGDAGSWGSVLNEFLEASHRPDGTLKSTMPVFNVKDFGALGDGIEDDTAAIQATIDYVKNLEAPQASDHPAAWNIRWKTGGIVYLPPGTYRISHLDCTRIGRMMDMQVIIQGAGTFATTLVHTGAGTAIDLSGSNNMVFRDFGIINTFTDLGHDCAFLLTRFAGSEAGAADFCNNNSFINLRIDVAYCKAAVVMVAAEETLWLDCRISNYGGSSPHTFFVSSRDALGIISPHGTRSGTTSTLANSFVNCNAVLQQNGAIFALDGDVGASINHCMLSVIQNYSARPQEVRDQYARSVFDIKAAILLTGVDNLAPVTISNTLIETDTADAIRFEGNGIFRGAYITGNYITQSAKVINCVGQPHIQSLTYLGNKELHHIELIGTVPPRFEFSGILEWAMIRVNSIAGPGTTERVTVDLSNCTFISGSDITAPEIVPGSAPLHGTIFHKLNETGGKIFQDVWNGGLRGRALRITPQSTDYEAEQKADSPGIFAVADGVNWSPAGPVNSTPYPVVWDGGHWKPLTAISAPSGQNSPGVPGTIAFDNEYVYICVAPDTWKRSQLGW